MTKQVQVARVQTMADGSIRLVVDLLDGNGEDFKNLFDLIRQETTMMICSTENLVDEVIELGNNIHKV